GMGQGEDLARGLNGLIQYHRLFIGGGHGLFTDDVEAVVQQFLGHWKMQEIGRQDGTDLNPLVLGELEFFFYEHLIVPVDPIGGDVDLSCKFQTFLMVGVEYGPDDLIIVIDLGSCPVQDPDQGIPSSSKNPKSNLFRHVLFS